VARKDDHRRARRLYRRLTDAERRHEHIRGDFALTAATIPARQKIEDFLYEEADLLDNWKLNEWLALFDQERGGYYIPSTDAPDSDPDHALFLIADDMKKLRSRVDQLLSGATWAENPKSRTRHMVNNVRILGMENDALLIKANFVVYRMRFEKIDPYIGTYHYKLIPHDGSFIILERKVILDLEALRPHGKVSFIV
jgi:p-cumate 2,3-dioxygenase beta subunit